MRERRGKERRGWVAIGGEVRKEKRCEGEEEERGRPHV